MELNKSSEDHEDEYSETFEESDDDTSFPDNNEVDNVQDSRSNDSVNVTKKGWKTPSDVSDLVTGSSSQSSTFDNSTIDKKDACSSDKEEEEEENVQYGIAQLFNQKSKGGAMNAFPRYQMNQSHSQSMKESGSNLDNDHHFDPPKKQLIKRKKPKSVKKHSDNNSEDNNSRQIRIRTKEEIDIENEQKVDILLQNYSLYNVDADKRVGSRVKADTSARKMKGKVEKKIQSLPPRASRNIVQNTEENNSNGVYNDHLPTTVAQKEREQALLDAIVDLSNQNEDLIKKLEISLRNELALERKILMLRTGIDESQISSAPATYTSTSTSILSRRGFPLSTSTSTMSSARSDPSSEVKNTRNGTFRNRLGDALHTSAANEM